MYYKTTNIATIQYWHIAKWEVSKMDGILETYLNIEYNEMGNGNEILT